MFCADKILQSAGESVANTQEEKNSKALCSEEHIVGGGVVVYLCSDTLEGYTILGEIFLDLIVQGCSNLENEVSMLI